MRKGHYNSFHILCENASITGSTKFCKSDAKWEDNSNCKNCLTQYIYIWKFKELWKFEFSRISNVHSIYLTFFVFCSEKVLFPGAKYQLLYIILVFLCLFPLCIIPAIDFDLFNYLHLVLLLSGQGEQPKKLKMLLHNHNLWELCFFLIMIFHSYIIESYSFK